ncbi:hypothetical protein P175DRAFT_0497961 [Aspergillus ochraceoroseus IBT 24754]|uniref:Uncharacterized protein n=2 Tax=Aspergillus ochraceoroseus TaxID=138278 RepID=A0A2T5M8K5_9EURO|nr:uncharacterized protein P175DRAFT_0497961 [Aspergillus ochraceoroseus IBT 24754]KKK23261.1 hypothetical protein AOCH_004705 [Aspergillus ochraceoroseus]PTU24861.1 hypothetical protein P175DRAFT_0497961 [Aspergillus ochraceoroseus IBT 24754]
MSLLIPTRRISLTRLLAFQPTSYPYNYNYNYNYPYRDKITPTAPFHSSTAQATLKESDHGRDDLDQVYEREKNKQVKKSKEEGTAEWSPDLASNSEASVKADRGEVEDNKDFIDVQNRMKNEAGKKR